MIWVIAAIALTLLLVEISRLRSQLGRLQTRLREVEQFTERQRGVNLDLMARPAAPASSPDLRSR